MSRPIRNRRRRRPLPEYDAEARLRGKSAVEHAEDLGDPMMNAPADGAGGADRHGARMRFRRADVVRFVVEHDGGTGFTDEQLDDLRMGGALGALCDAGAGDRGSAAPEDHGPVVRVARQVLTRGC